MSHDDDDRSIKEILKHNRPNLTESSLKTYWSIIFNLYKKLNNTFSSEPKSKHVVDFFRNESKKVLEHLDTLPYNLRKTKLAVIVSLLNGSKDSEPYRNLMLHDIKKYNDELSKQEPSEKQVKNWIKWDDVLAKAREYYNLYYKLLNKNQLTWSDKSNLMDMILLHVYTMIPPRRSADYTEFKVANIDKETDNYMDGSKFIFNHYKTAKKYHRQEVNIPRKLQLMIKKWASKSGNDYLLFNLNGNPMKVSALTMRLNKLFGKKVSSTMLRHVYISEVTLKAMPALQKLQNVAEEMGHSVNTQIQYRKFIPKTNTKTDLKDGAQTIKNNNNGNSKGL